MIYLIQHFEADFPQKVSLKILNSGIILKTLAHLSAKKENSAAERLMVGLQLSKLF